MDTKSAVNNSISAFNSQLAMSKLDVRQKPFSAEDFSGLQFRGGDNSVQEKAALAADIANAAHKRGWPEEKIQLAVSIINVESGFDPRADAAKSSAYGLGQLLDDPWHGTAEQHYRNGAVAMHNRYADEHPELGLEKFDREHDRKNPAAQTEVFLTFLDKVTIPRAEKHMQDSAFKGEPYDDVVYAFYHSYNAKDAAAFMTGGAQDGFPAAKWLNSADKAVTLALNQHEANPNASNAIAVANAQFDTPEIRARTKALNAPQDPAQLLVAQYQLAIASNGEGADKLHPQVQQLYGARQQTVGVITGHPQAPAILAHVDNQAIDALAQGARAAIGEKIASEVSKRNLDARLAVEELFIGAVYADNIQNTGVSR